MDGTVWFDGALASEKFFDFTGPSGTDTITFTVPNDGASHMIEVNSYSLTNGTPITGLPGSSTSRAGDHPLHPPCARRRRASTATMLP